MDTMPSKLSFKSKKIIDEEHYLFTGAEKCIILTWLVQLCKLCSPNPFKGITTDTLGSLS